MDESTKEKTVTDLVNRARRISDELENEEWLMIEQRAILALALAQSLVGPPGPQGNRGPSGGSDT